MSFSIYKFLPVHTKLEPQLDFWSVFFIRLILTDCMHQMNRLKTYVELSELQLCSVRPADLTESVTFLLTCEVSLGLQIGS